MKELYRLRKLLQKLRHLVGIDDTRGRAISDIEKQNIEQKIRDRNEKKKIADDNEELAADDDEDLDAPDEKETKIANQLRECCNKLGDEKQDMLQQSAGYLLELGKLYMNYAITGKDMQQKLNFVKSAALINAAMVRYQKLGLDDKMKVSKNELYKLHSEILKIDFVNGDKNVDIHKFSGEVKTVLGADRKDVYEKLDAIIANRKTISDEDRNKTAKSDQIKEICKMSTERYLDIMRMVANKCEAIMGKPPCEYSFIGLGSLARKEATLYSEFEHAIVLEDFKDNDPAMKEYFRWFTTIFHIIIIGLGETPMSSVNVRSLNDHYSSDKSKNWFSDSYTPHGITFDGMIPHAEKFHFGQQQATDYRTRTIELIQSARKMAILATQEDDPRNGYSLCETLRTTCPVYGNHEAHNSFSHYSHQILYYKKTVREIAKHESKLLLCPTFVAQQPWFLGYIQEKLTSFISAMSAVWGYECQSSYEVVDEMKDCELIDDETRQKLRNVLDVVMEVKMKTHQNRCCQSKNQLHIYFMKLIEEKMIMDCFVTVISLTVELQRQLDKASTCHTSDWLSDFELLFMEESTTLSAPAFDVVIKEVEFGLGLACQTINSFATADPKLASLEAKLAIKTASLIPITYFDRIFFRLMDGRMESFPNLLKFSSIGSILESLESHCNTLLKFTDGNNRELLLHYYPMMFLLHCIQNQFLQALEEYDRWLLLKKEVKSIDLPSTNVSLELLHIHIMSEALDANDMMTRIEQMISSESDYQKKYFLKIGLCLTKVKTGRTKEARKDLRVLVRDINKNPTKLEKEVQELLFKNMFDIQLSENFLVDATFTLHEEISSKQFPNILVSPILIWYPVHDRELLIPIQEMFQIVWGENLKSSVSLSEEYQPHTMQCVNSADPVECGFSLAFTLLFFNHRKCASLLWKTLHDPTVTEFLMQESVVWIFYILSYRYGPVDGLFFLSAIETAVRKRKTAIDQRKKASANIAVTEQRGPSQAMTTPPPINSSNKEIPATSLLQDAEEKPSNQEATHSLRKSFSLPHLRLTDSHIHSSSSDNEDLEKTEAVIASESRSVLIDKEGGKIEIGGCAVSFPLGSFDDVAEVYAKAEIDSSKWPPKYICITAMLWVKSQRKLLGRASVTMKSWCMKNCSDSRIILVDVLHQKIGSSKWDVVASLPLNDLKIFHFECTDFSPYILGVREDELVTADLVVEGRVYSGKRNNVSLAFFLQHDLLENKVEELMAKRDCKFELDFNSIPVKTNDKISAKLNCVDDTLHFPNEFKKDIKIDDDFVRLKKKAFFHSPLIGSTKEPQYVLLECTVQKNEVLEDGPHFFNYEWWPLKSVHPQQPPPGNQFSVQPGGTLNLDQSISGVVTANTMATGGAQVQTTRHDGNERVAVGNEVLSSLSDATKK